MDLKKTRKNEIRSKSSMKVSQREFKTILISGIQVKEIDRYRKRRRAKRPKLLNNENLDTTMQDKSCKHLTILSHNPFVIITFLALLLMQTVSSFDLHELPRINNNEESSNTNSSRNILQPPSQLFLTPTSHHDHHHHQQQQQLANPINLINGLKKSDIEDDDGGFIMKTVPPNIQNESTSDTDSVTLTTKEATPSEEATEASYSESSTTSPQIETTTLSDQISGSIPIDANRQQFLTHDQISLLNASTKDENIYLNGERDQESSNRQAHSPRSGLSKVSHVSSFLSDLFTYSWPRQDLNNSPQANNLATTSQRTSQQLQRQQQQQPPPQQQQQAASCPGVCRSVITASILCRHEINAPCPSIFQKCCEKDDVSFNGTPVETSAPISSTDVEPPNSAPQSEGNPTQEQPSFDVRQASQAVTSATRQQQQQQQPRTTPTTTAAPVSSRTTLSSVASAGVSATTTTAATTDEPSVDYTTRNVSPIRSSELPTISSTDSTVVLAGDHPGSSSIYFLSSGNGSSEQSTLRASNNNNMEQQQQRKQPQQPPSNMDVEQGARLKQSFPTSQSFDSPLSSVKPVESSTKSPNQVILVQTANGTIVHYAGEKVRRPVYANWTDYQMFMQQSRQNNGGQNVVYHSNIDPVKKFVDNTNSTRNQQQQQQAATQTPLSSAVATTASTSNYDLNTQQTPSQSNPSINNPRREITNREQLCNGLCIPKVHNLLCQTPSNQLKCGSENEFCCLQMTEEVTEMIKKSLANPGNSDLQRNANDYKDNDRVMNDQHSSNSNNKFRVKQQQIAASAATTTTTSTSTTTTQQPSQATSLAPEPANTTPKLSNEDQQLSTTQNQDFGPMDDKSSNKINGQQASGGVGDLLVGLLESWLGGSSSASQQEDSQQTPSDRLDSHATDQKVTYVDTSPYYEPQNDRRLGLDLSSRQQQQQQVDSNSTGQRQQVDSGNSVLSADSGLMTSDGTNEQMMESFSTNLNGDTKCRGFCVVPLFARICDSTYPSSDCTGFSRCCVSKSDDSIDQSNNQIGQFSNNNNNNNDNNRQQQQAPKSCRGQCLRIYHSSLCTKPSELQVDSPGCLPNFVCCAQPSVQDGTNHIEDLEGILTSSTSSNSDPVQSSQAVTASMLPNNEQIIKDNSLFTALMPPPPPNLSIVAPSAATVAEQQMIQQEKSYLNDQYLAANSRQRQSSPNQDAAAAAAAANNQIVYNQQSQQNINMNTRPGNAKASSQTGGGGIISQLYQMFSKSTASTKQRQRPQTAQPIQALQQPIQPLMSNFIPQLYDPYQIQAAASVLQPTNNISPQQLMFSNQNMLVNQAGQFPTTYQIDGSQQLELPQQQLQKQQQQNRNRFAQQQQQQQHQVKQPNMVVAASYQPQQQFGGQPLVQKQLSKNPYQQQQQQQQPQISPTVNLHQFNSDNVQPMINEKFAAPAVHTDIQSPTILAFNSANGINQHQQLVPLQQSQSQSQPQNYVKSPAINSQVGAIQKKQHLSAAPTTNNGFILPVSNFQNVERQRYQQHFSNSPDNAQSNVGLSQVQASLQHSTQPNGLKSSQSSLYPNQHQQQQQQQAVIGDTQKQITKPEQQNGQNRPIVGNQPARTSQAQQQQQQQQQEQRYSIAGNVRNGNGQQQQLQEQMQNSVQQQKQSNILNRQNSLNNKQTEMRQNVAEGTGGQLEIIPSGQSTSNQAARNPATFVVKGGQQTPLVGSQKMGNNLNSRLSGNNNAVVSAPNRQQSTKITSSAKNQQQQQAHIGDIHSAPSNALSSSSSNLNVMISNAPFIDLQRVESGSEASRRPLSTSGSNLSPTIVDITSNVGTTSTSNNNRAQIAGSNLKRHPQQQVATFNTATATNIDDLNTQTDLSQAQPSALCPSTCLAPFVSFNCVKPNYIDENYYCPNPSSVCCIKTDIVQKLSTTNTNQQESVIINNNNNRQKDQSQQEQQPHVVQNQPVVNNVEESNNNTLDTLSLSDQQDESDENLPINKQQVVEVSSSSSSSQSTPTAGNEITSADLNGLSSSTNGGGDEQSLSSIKKNRFQATSCGLPGPRRRTSGQAKGRVMGGFDAKPDYWCWQAALMNEENQYLCGGALIGTKWVLTAAHCVTKHLLAEKQLFVRLGQHDLNTTQGANNAETVRVNTSYVHHNHNGVTLDNDIALLKLDEAVDLDGPSICLVCLPEKSHQLEAGKRCTVTGYGYENENGPSALRIRQTDLPIVTDQECQNKTSTVLGKPFNLPASSFCAGGELGQDACHGDGGSPLSCLVDGYYELTGIVSWGYKCGNKDLPGLYSKVSTFVGWINQIVSVNN